MKLVAVVSTLSLASLAQAAVPSLSPDNYAELTAGKTVFIKFFAPWCGHCKSMAPDWEKLADEYASNPTALVAEVDCTAEGEGLCGEVQGFPTLKYGDPDALEDYEGGRSYDDLKKFAEENLKPMCSPANIDLCDDEKKAEIKKFQGMVGAELDKLIEEGEAKVKDAEKTFSDELQKLQDTYERLTKEREETEAAVKASGLGMMKTVKALKN